MVNHNFGKCRKCGEVHNRENGRRRNRYDKAIYRVFPSVKKFSSCADCRRKLKNGDTIFKRTVSYHFRQPSIMSIGCLVGYYCESCYNRRVQNGQKETE